MLQTEKQNPVSVDIQGAELTLFPERAAWWQREKTLFVADTHFGKASSFRRRGVPIPIGSTREDLERLSVLLERTRAERVIILGDLIHARLADTRGTITAVADWRKRYSNLDLLLVRGNHDRRAGDPPPEWKIRVEDEGFGLSPFLLCHEPREDERGYVLAGHIHPSVTVRDRDGSSCRFPCYLFGERGAILPAFGSFTGTFGVRPLATDFVYGIVDDIVFPIQ